MLSIFYFISPQKFSLTSFNFFFLFPLIIQSQIRPWTLTPTYFNGSGKHIKKWFFFIFYFYNGDLRKYKTCLMICLHVTHFNPCHPFFHYDFLEAIKPNFSLNKENWHNMKNSFVQIKRRLDHLRKTIYFREFNLIVCELVKGVSWESLSQ